MCDIGVSDEGGALGPKFSSRIQITTTVLIYGHQKASQLRGFFNCDSAALCVV